MGEVNRRRRRGCRAPRAGIKFIGTKGSQVLLCRCFAPGLRVVVASPGWVIRQLKDAVVEASGGKAGALGALLRAGLRVPDGFVVPFDEYRASVGRCHVEPLEEPHDNAGGLIGAMPISEALRDAIDRGLDVLGSPPVAVRSSANTEDTAEASAAGQYESILAVQGADVVADAVQACWASLHSGRAINYCSAIDRDAASGSPVMAVLVQRLIDAEVSGVMFTPPRPEGATHIEASWGLGPTVVGGTVSQTHTASPLTGRRAALSRIKGSGWTVTECDWSRAAFRRSIAARQCSMAQLLHDLPASGGRLPVCSTDHRTSSGPLLMAGSGSCRPGRSPLHLHCPCHTRWLPAPAPHRRQLWWERPAARGPSPERRGLSAAPITSPESALETS